MTASERSNSHVGRVFALLDTIAEQAEAVTLSQLARLAELPVSTVHRLLAELVSWGGVERTPAGRYRLGDKIWRLGVRSPWERHLRDSALPVARELARQTGAAVAISAMINDRLVCLDTVRGRLDSIYLARAGDDLPLFATSAGKLLMSTAERSVLVEALRNRLIRRTPYTQVVPKLVLAQLDRARQTGFATTYSESTAGQASVSVRVHTDDDSPQMALTMLHPATQRDLASHVPVLRQAAASIGRAVGAR